MNHGEAVRLQAAEKYLLNEFTPSQREEYEAAEAERRKTRDRDCPDYMRNECAEIAAGPTKFCEKPPKDNSYHIQRFWCLRGERR